MREQWQDRIYNYSIEPPDGAWEQLSSALDDAFPGHVFPGKIYRTRIAPPSGTWQKISAVLYGNEQATQVPVRRILPWQKLTAAAAVLVLIVWGGLKLINQKAQQSLASVTKTNSPALTNNLSQPEQRIPEEIRSSIPVKQEQTFTKKDSRSLSLPSPSGLPNPRFPDEDLALGNASMPVSYAMNTRNKVVLNRDILSDCYINLSTPEGQLVRLSRKFGDLACCVSGEQEDAACQDKLNCYRDKIIQSTAASSSGSGFIDMLNMVKQLSDN
jgi:hypothetical protein